MAVQTLFDTGSTYSVDSMYDGGVYDIAVGGDCVCGGIGDEFTPTYSSSSLDVVFAQGSEAIVGGSFFKLTSSSTVTLAANSTIYLCATIDKSQANGSRGSFQQRTSSSMQSGNLNGSGTVRDLLLYVIVTSSSGVTSVTDKRVIKSGSEDRAGKYKISVLTESEWESLSSKDSKTLYFIKES